MRTAVLRVRISTASTDHVDRAPYEQALIWFPSATLNPYNDLPIITTSATMYALRTDSPVKWTSQQERTIAQEFPWSSPISDTAAEYVSRTYIQFLWLPEVSTRI